MSKALGKVAMIAGAVALAATGVGALAGAGVLAAGVQGAAISAIAAGVGQYATLAAVAASIGAQVTAKKPPAKGAVNNVLIASDAPAPYLIGRTNYGGVLRHDVGYGQKLNKVKNPFRGMVIVYSVAGPVQGLEKMTTDFQTVTFAGNAATGYYSGFLYRDFKLGGSPETALSPNFGGMPNWGSDYKLSGKAAILWNLKFDKKAKRFASGVPALGAVWNGVLCYDPRKDSTYPGGSGSHRWADPHDTTAHAAARLTWEFSEDPGLHALKYALGSWERDEVDPASQYVKVFGIGDPIDGVIVDHFVTLANVCQANGWKVGGVIFEPGDRWANLKDILQAGCAEPAFIGGRLGLKINAPRVAIDRITREDLAEDDAEIPGAQTWRARRNGLIPKYRSEAHKWDYVQSALVSVPEYVAQDGEKKEEERQLNLVQDKDQAAQIVAYELVNGRELGPITLVCGPRLRKYGPGDMLTVDLPDDHGLDAVDCVIIDRTVDPQRMTVALSLISETPGKHPFALGQTGTAPPVPVLVSPEEKDGVASSVAGDDLDPVEMAQVTPGSGSAVLAWINPGAPFRSYRVYRNTSNNRGTATSILGPVVGTPGAPVQVTDTVVAGTYWWWIVAYDDDGNSTEPEASVTGTVT